MSISKKKPLENLCNYCISLTKMEKLTTGAVVPAGGDVVRDGVNQGLA